MSDDLDTVASLRKRDREHDEVGDLMTILAVAMLFLTGQGSSARFPTRKIQRAAEGPMGSTMMGYYNYGDQQTFLYNFRMTKDQLEGGHRLVERQSDLTTPGHEALSLPLPKVSIEVSQRCALPQHSCKPLCTSCFDPIELEKIEVSQRCTPNPSLRPSSLSPFSL
jgi:hypothetical protein